MNGLEAAADKAELTGQIRSFMAWLGEGRRLTQTGRIGLADARHLVEVTCPAAEAARLLRDARHRHLPPPSASTATAVLSCLPATGL